jgi:hypothetical protein
MDWKQILMDRFVWGLAIGLFVWLFSVIKYSNSLRKIKKDEKVKNMSLQNEITKLKEHLQTQLEIEAEKKELQKGKLEQLKSENENLRITAQTLKLKPKREEMILLQIYDRAIHIMLERAPGFGPTWENTLKEAKKEIDQANKGVIPFIKRIIHPSAHPVITAKNIKQSKQLTSENDWDDSI